MLKMNIYILLLCCKIIFQFNSIRCNSQIYHFMYCNGNTKMCKKIAYPEGCSIFRIQVENLTREGGGGLRPRRSYVYIFSLSYSSISGGKNHKFAWQRIENLGAKIFWSPKSKIAAHNKVEIQF